MERPQRQSKSPLQRLRLRSRQAARRTSPFFRLEKQIASYPGCVACCACWQWGACGLGGEAWVLQDRRTKGILIGRPLVLESKPCYRAGGCLHPLRQFYWAWQCALRAAVAAVRSFRTARELLPEPIRSR